MPSFVEFSAINLIIHAARRVLSGHKSFDSKMLWNITHFKIGEKNFIDMGGQIVDNKVHGVKGLNIYYSSPRC